MDQLTADRARARVLGAIGAELALYSLGFAVLCFAIQLSVGAFQADLGLTGDEAAHFVSAAMISSWLTSGAAAHPMRFAVNYYEHFPRVAIGHWPPFFYVLQGLIFTLTGPTVAAALALQAGIAGLASGVPAAFAHRRWGLVPGLATGALVFLSPVFLFQVDAVMLDNLCGLMVALAALCWARFWIARTPANAALFAACAICATMTKGNALGLALMPPVQFAIARDARLLRSAKTWAIGAAVGAIVVPWYGLTYKLTAAGFNYSFGPHFTALAAASYAPAVLQMIGIPAALGFLVMAARIIRERGQDRQAAALLSAVIGTLVFQLIAPADIQPRYLVAGLPAAAPLCIGGLWYLGTLLARYARRWQVGAVAASFTLLMTALSIAPIFRAPRIRPLGMNTAAATIVAADAPNPLVLICASPTGEGAAIAAFAALEPQPEHYVIRGSQALAASNFMGTEYRSLVASPEQLATWLTSHHIGWIVVETSRDSQALAHNQTALELVQQPHPNWTRTASIETPANSVSVYELPDSKAQPTGVSSLLRQVMPKTVIRPGGD